MLRRYPETLRWRQGLPPLFVLSVLVGAVLAIFLPIFRVLLAVEVLAYGFVLVAAGVHSSIKQKNFRLVFGLPVAIATMHIAWGAGFLWSMIKGVYTDRSPEKK